MRIHTLASASLGLLTFGAVATTHASELYGVTFPGATDLFRINQSTGAAGSVGPTGQDGLGDLTSDTRAGSERMWAIRIASNSLYEINPATGAASNPVALNSPDSMVSIAFDPVGGKLYGNTSVGFGAPFEALYEIDPATGNTTFVGRILFDNVFALAFDQAGGLYGVSDASDEFISISTATGNGALIAPLGLGLSFDIASRPEDNVMFLADSGTFSLYQIDTGTGATSLVGPYGSPQNMVGLAFAGGVVPEASTVVGGASLALLAAGSLWRRHRAQRG